MSAWTAQESDFSLSPQSYPVLELAGNLLEEKTRAHSFNLSPVRFSTQSHSSQTVLQVAIFSLFAK